jgi:L-lactate dehydrogenase complex protein LldG
MGGAWVDAVGEADLAQVMRRVYPQARVICSATAEVRGTRTIDGVRAPAELDDVADLHAVYRNELFGTATYATLLTGPSAAADAEGVLVQGAQGVRSLTVVTCRRQLDERS